MINWLAVANWALRRAGLGPVAATYSESEGGPQHQPPLSEYEWSICAADNDIQVHGSFPLSQISERQRREFLSGHMPECGPLTEAIDHRESRS